MSNNKDKKGSKSKYNLRNKKNDDKTKLKKGSRDPDSEPEEEDTSDEEIDMKEYRKLLSTMFPSKYMKDKTKKSKKSKGKRRKDEDEDDDDDDDDDDEFDDDVDD